MRVYFIGNSDKEQFLSIDNGSLVLISYDLGIDIDLVKELDGDSNILRMLSDYSRRRKLVIVCGIRAKVYHRNYLSVAVIDSGKIMGVSDATHRVDLDAKYNLGASYRVYKTSLGYAGIIVHSDVKYPEVWRALCTHKSDYIIGLAGGIIKNDAKTAISALSYLNGITTLSLIGNNAFIVGEKGNVILDELADKLSYDITVNRDKTLENHLRYGIYDNVFIEGDDNK